MFGFDDLIGAGIGLVGSALKSPTRQAADQTQIYNTAKNLLAPLNDPTQDLYSQRLRSQGLRDSAMAGTNMASSLNKLGFGNTTYAPAYSQASQTQAYQPYLDKIAQTQAANRSQYYNGMLKALGMGQNEANANYAADLANQQTSMKMLSQPGIGDVFSPDKLARGLFGDKAIDSLKTDGIGGALNNIGGLLGGIGSGLGQMYQGITGMFNHPATQQTGVDMSGFNTVNPNSFTGWSTEVNRRMNTPGYSTPYFSSQYPVVQTPLIGALDFNYKKPIESELNKYNRVVNSYFR